MFRITLIVAILGFSVGARAMMCDPGDTHIGGSFRVEYQTCIASGYCHAYGYNPATGKYEYYYGYHSSCPGRQERRVEDIQCRKTDGHSYTLTDYGWWSGCQVN